MSEELGCVLDAELDYAGFEVHLGELLRRVRRAKKGGCESRIIVPVSLGFIELSVQHLSLLTTKNHTEIGGGHLVGRGRAMDTVEVEHQSLERCKMLLRQAVE